MAVKIFEVDSYQIIMESESARTNATIRLYDRSGGYPASVHFQGVRDTTPELKINLQGKTNLYLPDASYPKYLDLLRNESPIRCRIDSDENHLRLYSASEATGEGE